MRQQRRFGFGIVCSAAVGAVILGGAAAALAQEEGGEAEASTKDANGKTIVEPKVEEGEIRMDGTVKAIMSGDRFSIEASSFTTAKGKVVEFVTAKQKTITVAGDSLIQERVNPANKQPFSEVKLGRRITIVGRDAGSGKPLAARLVVLWPEKSGDFKTLATVRIGPAAGRLIDQSDEAYRLRDLDTALRLAERAVSAAQQSGDRAGQALSLGRAARIHSDKEEPEKAMELHQQALGLWQALGNPINQAIAMSNIASVYGALGQGDKALETLQAAITLVQNSGNRKLIATIWGHLGSYYMSDKQYDKAMEAFEQVLPLVSGQTDKGEEADVTADMAYLMSVSDQEDKARSTVERAAAMLDSIGDKRYKAGVLTTIAGVYRNLKENAKALDYLRQSLFLLKDLGDRRGYEVNEKRITDLEKGVKEDDAP